MRFQFVECYSDLTVIRTSSAHPGLDKGPGHPQHQLGDPQPPDRQDPVRGVGGDDHKPGEGE